MQVREIVALTTVCMQSMGSLRKYLLSHRKSRNLSFFTNTEFASVKHGFSVALYTQISINNIFDFINTNIKEMK